jgi:hypothetical protein
VKFVRKIISQTLVYPNKSTIFAKGMNNLPPQNRRCKYSEWHRSVGEVLDDLRRSSEEAITQSGFRRHVDALRFHIVENWCLCEYCRLFQPGRKRTRAYTKDLNDCINHLKTLHIKWKPDKQRLLTEMLVRDYNYDNPERVGLIIRDRFSLEGITEEDIRKQISTNFTIHIAELIAAIAADR